MLKVLWLLSRFLVTHYLHLEHLNFLQPLWSSKPSSFVKGRKIQAFSRVGKMQLSQEIKLLNDDANPANPGSSWSSGNEISHKFWQKAKFLGKSTCYEVELKKVLKSGNIWSRAQLCESRQMNKMRRRRIKSSSLVHLRKTLLRNQLHTTSKQQRSSTARPLKMKEENFKKSQLIKTKDFYKIR